MFRRVSFWFSDHWTKIVAVIIIFALAFADFLAMRNLFEDLYLSDYLILGDREIKILSEANVYPFTFAVLLEGNPFFMGIAATMLADNTKYKVNDRLNAKIGLIISIVAFVLTICLVWILRGLLISQNGGLDAFFKTKDYGGPSGNNETFIAQIYLLAAPLLTSLLAFVASWTAFRSESITKLEYRLEKLHTKYLIAQSKFLDTIHRNDDARTALWGSLTAKDKIPSDLDTFRKECFDRIRSKLISNSITEFPDQIERYNAEISKLLQEFIGEMSLHTTSIPRDIEEMDINDVLAEYDKKQKDENALADAWSYSICGASLEEELKKVLDNAVVVAQFKTSIRPFHKERDL